MWLFTPTGFVSVVKDRSDRRFVLVRARERSHLVALGLTPRRTPVADYLWRARIMKKRWAGIAQKAALAIDYDNFKAAAEDKAVAGDWYSDGLHVIWAELYHRSIVGNS